MLLSSGFPSLFCTHHVSTVECLLKSNSPSANEGEAQVGLRTHASMGRAKLAHLGTRVSVRQLGRLRARARRASQSAAQA
ncbi:hypothetical protein EGR_05292 [Echinococcus granulosus]|uniref:Uncharacterized protein n=1 Tax=Echinococcus granulosus TaxID=6210 RepID=W6UFU1_ECHGR|nr:hypothetical protein EGR_05292 [Echinococcus granulosus]EUB59816.1 hypothetical protein EGR_05292 [Echinococcus granulosus]